MGRGRGKRGTPICPRHAALAAPAAHPLRHGRQLGLQGGPRDGPALLADLQSVVGAMGAAVGYAAISMGNGGRAVPAAGPPGRGPAAVAPAREQDHGYGITEYVPCDAAFGHPVTVRGQPVTVREQRRPRLRGVGAPRSRGRRCSRTVTGCPRTVTGWPKAASHGTYSVMP